MTRGDERLALLLSEHRRVTDAIAQREGRIFRTLLFGFPILGSGLATAVRFDVTVAIVLVPFLVQALGLYWAQTSRDIVVWGGYARYLEGRLNATAQAPCFHWEAVAHKHLQANLAGVALGVFAIGVWLVSAMLGIQAAVELWNWPMAVLLLLLMLAGLAAIGMVAWGFRSSWQEAYETAQSMEAGNVAISRARLESRPHPPSEPTPGATRWPPQT